MISLLVKSLVFAMTALAQAAPLAAQETSLPKMNVAFFYGYPSLINGAQGNIQKAVSAFAPYNVIVLGDGVQFNTRVKKRRPVGVGAIEYQRSRQIAAAILEQRPHTDIYGYISLGDTQALPGSEVQRRIHLWKDFGATGIFLDEAGYDWRIVTRNRQNSALNAAHSLGMKVFINAYYPDSLLNQQKNLRKNSKTEEVALQPHDLLLLESMPVKNGIYVSAEEWRARLDQALRVRNAFGTRIVSLATGTREHPLDQGQVAYSCWNAWMFELDGVAWADSTYSSNSVLSVPACNDLATVRALGPRSPLAVAESDRFTRQSTQGTVTLDVARNSVQVAPKRAEHLAANDKKQSKEGLASVLSR